jgi:hypothetical protein
LFSCCRAHVMQCQRCDNQLLSQHDRTDTRVSKVCQARR